MHDAGDTGRPSAPNPLSSRRGLLVGAFATSAAVSMPGRAIAGENSVEHPSALLVATADDPLETLCGRYLAVEARAAPIEAEHTAVRAGLIERWGELTRGETAHERWGHDAAEADLRRLMHASDALNDESRELLEAIQETPARSLAGIVVKLRIATEIWPERFRRGLEFHEEFAIEAISDAVCLLAEGNAPG